MLHRLLQHVAVNDLLTIPEVAKIFVTSRQSVYRWIKKGGITALRTPGGTLRVRRADVEAALRDGVIEPESVPDDKATA